MGWSGTVTIPLRSTTLSTGSPAMYFTIALEMAPFGSSKQTPCTEYREERISTNAPFPTSLDNCICPLISTSSPESPGLRFSILVQTLLVSSWLWINGASPKLSLPTPASLSAFSFSLFSLSNRLASFLASFAAFAAAFLAFFSLFLLLASCSPEPFAFFSFFSFFGGPKSSPVTSLYFVLRAIISSKVGFHSSIGFFSALAALITSPSSAIFAVSSSFSPMVKLFLEKQSLTWP
mmetsp:Transcript_54724/g.81261  ORF Transcript_54724/g.81261 Transcript_54724/m.81261 type:complete len:235 (-) Transcript_54724:8-712(-)